MSVFLGTDSVIMVMLYYWQGQFSVSEEAGFQLKGKILCHPFNKHVNVPGTVQGTESRKSLLSKYHSLVKNTNIYNAVEVL